MGNIIRKGNRDKDLLRGMKTSKAERPQISVGTGNPSGGRDGDIRMSMTQSGPILFCKFQGKWFSTGLKEVTGGVTTEVKTHYMSGIKEAGSQAYIPLNAAIVPRGSVVGIILFMNHSGDYWHIYNWKEDDDKAATEHEVYYRGNSHQIEIRKMGTQIDGVKEYRLLIFYI